jgi:hypothetical protein
MSFWLLICRPSSGAGGVRLFICEDLRRVLLRPATEVGFGLPRVALGHATGELIDICRGRTSCYDGLRLVTRPIDLDLDSSIEY